MRWYQYSDFFTESGTVFNKKSGLSGKKKCVCNIEIEEVLRNFRFKKS